MFKESHF